jgi:glycosyltransferase involved in cell wall biosynthesis
MKKKLLFVRRTYGFGGMEVRLLDWLGQIDYSQNEVLVVSPTDVFSERIAKRGIPAKYVALSPKELLGVFGRYDPRSGTNELLSGGFWRFFKTWLRFLCRIRPDAVIMMEGNFFSLPLACVLAAFLVTRGNVYMTEHLGIPKEPPRKVSRVHFGFLPGLGLWWYKQVWPEIWPWRMRGKLSKRILSASETVKNRIVSFYGYPAEKMGIIHHGVDTERFCPSPTNKMEWRRAHNIPERDLVVVSTCELRPQKRIDRLLQAFDSVSCKHDNLWLLLTGDGELREDVKRWVAHTQGNQRIKLLGHLENVGPVLQASDIYVLPSDNEGFGIALIEAMATKLVCVATRTPGPDGIIDDGENGFLADLTYEGVLSGLERALLLSPSERERMGEKARRTVLEKYELKRAVENALELLDIEIADRGRHAGGSSIAGVKGKMPPASATGEPRVETDAV